MRVCPECRKAPWPYFIIVFIASFFAVLTWLALDSAGVTPAVNRWWTSGAFAGTCVLLFGYMYWCIRVHCRHNSLLPNIHS